MKLYVFAIGGSGARVLRSLTMLLAAGVEMPEGTEIIPIILDPDQGSGNLGESVDLLKRYQEIRGIAKADLVENPSTFSTELSSLPGESFVIPLEGVADAKYKEYLGVNMGMSEETQALIQSLFSPENLELNMEVGFKGNPNIGSVVLGQFVESQVYKDLISHLENNAQSDQRIFIISSIFGGTGASGFPTLLKSLRTQEGVVQNVRMGALSIQPYFAVNNDPDSAIDSSTFYPKTRAAMSYYLKNIVGNNDVDDFYMIGDTQPNSYANEEGGRSQRNDAHFVELASALSIIDFAHKPRIDASMVREGKMYEFGVKKDEAKMTFKSLGTKTEKALAAPLTTLYLMRRYLEHVDVTASSDVWLKAVQPAMDIAFVDKLKQFLADYEVWLEELAGQGNHAFSPIKLNQSADNLFDCVEGYPVELGFMDKLKKQNFGLYTNNLNQQGEVQSMGELLQCLSDVSYELTYSKINLPS